MGCPSEGSSFLKLFIVDFMPLKSKILSVLSLLPDSSREPVWSRSMQDMPFAWPADPFSQASALIVPPSFPPLASYLARILGQQP